MSKAWLQRWKPISAVVSATFLEGVVLFIAVWGGARGWAAWHGAAWLQTLPLQVPWLYLLASGLAWLLAGTAAWAMQLSGHPWASHATAATVVLFSIFWWVDRYALTRNGLFRHNWPFALFWTLMIVAAVVSETAPPVWKLLFGADDERTS